MKNYNQSEKASHYEKLVKLFDLSNTGLWEMNARDQVVFFNANFYKQFDLPLENSTLDDWIKLVHPDDKHLFVKGLDEHEEAGAESAKSNYRVINKKGQVVWIEAQGIASFKEDGTFDFMVGSHTDVTSMKAYNDRLFDLAFYDELTGLYNRNKLEEDMKKDIEEGREGTIILIDLHSMPQVTTVYGQKFADRMMLGGTRELKEFCGDRFRLYRVSYQKIICLTHETLTRSQIIEFIHEVDEGNVELRKKHDINVDTNFRSAVVHYPLVSEDISVEDIINRTYLALKESSSRQSDEAVFYSDEVRDRVLRKIHIETSILPELAEGNFSVEFQPIVDANKHHTTGFEALIRWKSPVWGSIFPDEFIPVAEKNMEIVQLGEFVLHEALAFIKRYNHDNNSNLGISVNASAIELMQLNYVDKVLNELGTCGVNPENLTIEITESVTLENSRIIRDHLVQLRQLGVGVAMDDFGTGYASLNSMIKMPLTKLKIDRSITWDMLKDNNLFDLMSSIVALCHRNSVDVVVEGVENQAMVALTQVLKADCIQGYYFSKPLKMEDALSFNGQS